MSQISEAGGNLYPHVLEMSQAVALLGEVVTDNWEDIFIRGPNGSKDVFTGN